MDAVWIILSRYVYMGPFPRTLTKYPSCYRTPRIYTTDIVHTVCPPSSFPHHPDYLPRRLLDLKLDRNHPFPSLHPLCPPSTVHP